MRGRYQPISLAEDGTLLSRATGLRMKPEGLRLRLIDATTGEPILWPEEAEVALGRVEVARRDAEARAQAAEARAKALEEELKRIREA